MPKIEDYEGREQGLIKHCLLEEYLVPLVYAVGQVWDKIVYVDGFAGPWGAKDEQYADASFGLAVKSLTKAVNGLRSAQGKDATGQCIFVEREPGPFKLLKAYADSVKQPNVTAFALNGHFIDKVPEIEAIIKGTGKKPFKFVFLDPKGWAGFPMQRLKGFVTGRSGEVLVNLMTAHMRRFLEANTREKSFHELFGRDGVLEKVRSETSTDSKVERLVREYCKSLREVCGFRYVSEAVVLTPGKEDLYYYLIFATHSPKGVEVFKRAETTAARLQDSIRQEARNGGQDVFDFGDGPQPSPIAVKLRARYSNLAQRKMLSMLLQAASGRNVPYIDLYCETMAFPLVTPDDLANWLSILDPAAKLLLAGSNRRKKPSYEKDDHVQVVDRDALRARLDRLVGPAP